MLRIMLSFLGGIDDYCRLALFIVPLCFVCVLCLARCYCGQDTSLLTD